MPPDLRKARELFLHAVDKLPRVLDAGTIHTCNLRSGTRPTASFKNDAGLDALRSHEEFKQLLLMIEKDQQ